jgi:hypothetical protein
VRLVDILPGGTSIASLAREVLLVIVILPFTSAVTAKIAAFVVHIQADINELLGYHPNIDATERTQSDEDNGCKHRHEPEGPNVLGRAKHAHNGKDKGKSAREDPHNDNLVLVIFKLVFLVLGVLGTRQIVRKSDYAGDNDGERHDESHYLPNIDDLHAKGHFLERRKAYAGTHPRGLVLVVRVIRHTSVFPGEYSTVWVQYLTLLVSTVPAI